MFFTEFLLVNLAFLAGFISLVFYNQNG